MNNIDYLKKIHLQIKFKKIKNNVIKSTGFLSICLIIFFLTNKSPTQDELLFSDLYNSVSLYEWEIENDLSLDEIYFYLIDNTYIEDFDTIDDENMLKWIENLNLGG